jgi:hypothetical protein
MCLCDVRPCIGARPHQRRLCGVEHGIVDSVHAPSMSPASSSSFAEAIARSAFLIRSLGVTASLHRG